MDRTVARLHREFKRLGELGRTVFIFHTDNGQFFGEHGVAGGKLYPYEEANRIPLLIRLPPRYRNGHRRVANVSEPVANIDLAPTILRLDTRAPVRETVAAGSWTGDHCSRCCAGNTRWASDRPLGVEVQLQQANTAPAVCEYTGARLPGVIFVRHTRVADPAGPAA